MTTDDTFKDRGIAKVEQEGEVLEIDYFTAGEAGLKAGLAGKIAAGAEVVTICDAAAIPDCIILHRHGFNADKVTIRHLDTEYDDADKNVPVARRCKNKGKTVWMWLSTTVACDIENNYVAAANGILKKWVNETENFIFCKGAEYKAADNTYLKLRRMVIT